MDKLFPLQLRVEPETNKLLNDAAKKSRMAKSVLADIILNRECKKIVDKEARKK